MPDPKEDDYVFQLEPDFEPIPIPQDSFAQNQKCEKLIIIDQSQSNKIISPERDLKRQYSRRSRSTIADNESLGKIDRKMVSNLYQDVNQIQKQQNANKLAQNKEAQKPQMKALDIKEFKNLDGFNEDIIDFLRARVDSKVNKSTVVPEKKKRGAGLPMFGQQQEEILKKDHTYDHDGNLIEVKSVKTDYLPSIQFNQTRVKLNGQQQVYQSEFNRKQKSKAQILNPHTEHLQKEFNNQLNSMFAKENQKIEVTKDIMNVRDSVRPTYGVSIQDGPDHTMIGPDYKSKMVQYNKMSRKDYKEKYDNFDIQHRFKLRKTENAELKESKILNQNKSDILSENLRNQSSDPRLTIGSRRKVNRTAALQQRIKVLASNAKEEVIDRSINNSTGQNYYNSKLNTPSYNGTLNNNLINSMLVTQQNDLSMRSTPKDPFFSQRNRFSARNSSSRLKPDKVISKPQDLETRQLSIQSQLSMRQNARRPNESAAGDPSTYNRKRLSQNDNTFQSIISTQINFLDRSTVQSQMGTRSRLNKLKMKQKLLKDEYRPEILPPPPVGKSTGHGLAKRQSSIVEEPEKSIVKREFSMVIAD
ncbi:UNKNOWN [Stylonychia lemnae]|uniref:Uncharacterized protein n=1 Tax=Stylonychia lemnae TaxID=5949 RepID=A0A077ZZL6_STYLE|nr:UNKNOWN [Stylonychia lemnae]|eukprot:CDW73968.1 UNKNOWN [Stylonychia lemnae]